MAKTGLAIVIGAGAVLASFEAAGAGVDRSNPVYILGVAGAVIGAVLLALSGVRWWRGDRGKDELPHVEEPPAIRSTAGRRNTYRGNVGEGSGPVLELRDETDATAEGNVRRSTRFDVTSHGQQGGTTAGQINKSDDDSDD